MQNSTLLRHDDGSHQSLGGGALLGDDLVRDAVQIALTLRRQLAATVRVLLDQLNALEGLQRLTRVSVSGAAEMRRGDTVALAAAVHLGDGSHTDRRAVVQMAENGRASHVEPVRIVGRQLLELGGLDDVHGVRDLELAGSARAHAWTQTSVKSIPRQPATVDAHTIKQREPCSRLCLGCASDDEPIIWVGHLLLQKNGHGLGDRRLVNVLNSDSWHLCG